jgi:hypothetical protein
MSLRRPLVAISLVALAGLALTLAFLRIVVPEPTYHAESRPLRDRALTQQLMLVVVDGLRFDIATNPERMPRFSERMKSGASAEVWAGRVSMTSSAVLAFGTGQPGGMDQVVRNIRPRPPAFDSWLAAAKRRGLTLMAAGDPVWKQMYGADLVRTLLDPPGAGIEEDFNPKTFRDTRELLAEQPNFLVAHFVTPDHQGHSYGIFSARYAAHIHGYDRQLDELLRELGPSWTVIVTSDHGAVDSGTHGSDTPVQRRTPAFAFGAGIAHGARVETPVDQLDLAATMATLLGVEPPVHSRGHVLVEWLAIEPAERDAIACEEARRVLSYAKAEVGADVALDSCASTGVARAAVRSADRILSERTGISSPRATISAIVGCVFFALIALVILGRSVLPFLPAATLLAAAAAALVFYTERLPGSFPNLVRGTLFALLFAPVLVLLLKPAPVMRLLQHRFAPLFVPGLMLATYTANTQPVAYVAVAVTFVTLCRERKLEVARIVLVALALFCLARAGFKQTSVFPDWYLKNVALGQLVAVASVVVWFLLQSGSHRDRVIGLVPAVASIFLRAHVPPVLGRAAIIAFGIAACVVAFQRSRLLALGLGLAGFVWVSRNHEIVAVVLTLLVAEGIGAAARDREPDRAHLLLLSAAGFGLVFLQRLGIQNELDFGGLDLQAAAFGDPHVSAAVIGVAIGYKYLLAAVLVLAVLVAPLSANFRAQLLPALGVTFVARTALLVLLLFVCGSSYWTGLRVMADVPFPFLGALAALLLWLGVLAQPAASRSSSS